MTIDKNGLLAQFPDNTSGDIDAVNMRNVIDEVADEVNADIGDLATHEGQTGNTAHAGMLVTADLDAHKAGADQHPISGVTGLQTALDGKAGTGDVITLHADLTGRADALQHPGDAIFIAAGVQGNAVSIGASGELVDSGQPPGGSGATDITIDQSGASNIVVESSSGADGTIVPATQSNAGGMAATDKTKLDGLEKYPTRHATVSSPTTWDTELDGGAYTYQANDGANLTTWTASVPSDGVAANDELTASIDFLPPASGSWTMTIPAAWHVMAGFTPLTLNAGDKPATIVLRMLADATVQIYGSVAA